MRISPSFPCFKRLGSAVLIAGLLHGCAAYDEAIESQKVAYKRAEKREVGLDVPPDLTTQQPDEQFLIPGERETGPVSASDYYAGRQSGRSASPAAYNGEPVLLKPKDVEIRKVGGQRAVFVQRQPGAVYADLKKFWKETGFDLVVDDPSVGLLETNWLENRASIPMDGVRKYIGRVFDGVYSSNMRDKYRTRIEPVDGGVEVYITHRGMEEVFTDQNQVNLMWQVRPSDPELEAIMANRFVAYLTGQDAKELEAKTPSGKALVSLNKSPAGTTITLAEDFPVAWRRIGLALDRSGFIVEDRDRANGTYYVRFSPDSSSDSGKKKGFFGNLFDFGGGDELARDQRLQVSVVADSNTQTSISFLNEKGSKLDPKVSEQASGLLAEKIR